MNPSKYSSIPCILVIDLVDGFLTWLCLCQLLDIFRREYLALNPMYYITHQAHLKAILIPNRKFLHMYLFHQLCSKANSA